MNKYEKFMLSAALIGSAVFDMHEGCNFLAIPIALYAIYLLCTILKEELGL